MCSVRWGGSLRHYVVFEDQDKDRVRLGKKTFKDIQEMVEHYMTTEELVKGRSIDVPFKLLYPIPKQKWELDHNQIKLQDKLGQGKPLQSNHTTPGLRKKKMWEFQESSEKCSREF